jgi:thiaminase/transcriptional activator TenA
MAATTATLFETLRRETATLHQRTLDHPTVRGIGDGTLPESRFRFYLEQDFQFLLRFVRVLAITASSANELETMAQLSRLVTSTIDVEIDALRELYASFGGDPAALDGVEPAPACEAYCNHLLATVHERNPLVSIAAFLPCHWGYYDIGLHLRRRGLPSDARYAAWVEEYASDQYGELVHWVIERFNALGSRASAGELRAASRAFELSARYEYGFWEMAWTQERWPEAVTNG